MDGCRSILTVDYEEWFHILEPDRVKADSWAELPAFAPAETLQLLDLLDQYGSRATFFVVGWLGERDPEILREVARRGHRLASHGYSHRPPANMSESDFRNDLKRSIAMIENLAGVRVEGYRAPGFGVRNCAFPYLDVLSEFGLSYDSSVFPGVFPGRGELSMPSYPHHPSPEHAGFWEVPVSAVRVLGFPIVFSGGGFLRVLPTWFIRWSASRVARSGNPVVYYLHPRDANPRGPRIAGRGWKQWRYYAGRATVRRKLESILASERTVSIEEFLGDPESELPL